MAGTPTKQTAMDPFSPVHQPDEGYSEDPLNPPAESNLLASLATLRGPSDLPTWLINNASRLPVSMKTGMRSALNSFARLARLTSESA